MLKELQCIHFSQQKILFHPGCNIILGDDEAKNSIGKSTILMVIDFILGGSDFLKDDSGAIRELGHHSYNFCFEFNKELMFFSRSTDEPDFLYSCNEDYSKLKKLSIQEYTDLLKLKYKLTNLKSSFRSIQNPFSRIWKKDGLDTNHPFSASTKEKSEAAANRLIDMFEYSESIASKRELLLSIKNKKTLLSNSFSAGIIPKIDKEKYKENIKTILRKRDQIEKLKQGLGGSINVYETLFDEKLREKQHLRDELSEALSDLQNKIKRLRREISGVTPKIAANIFLLSEYFPEINVDRLARVEEFHRKIGSIVRRELNEELKTALQKETVILGNITSVDLEIKEELMSKGMPDDIFKRVLELKDVVDKIGKENEFYEKYDEVIKAIKLENENLQVIYKDIFNEIQRRVNLKLQSFNRVVYDPSRDSPKLSFKNSSSYQFSSAADSGTGKSFAGLIGFDMAMLSLTKLPIVLHDSILYKNIEVSAARRILRVLTAAKSKQIFLSFDEAKKYGENFERRLRKFSVLKLGDDRLLYVKDWRDKK